MNRVSGDLCEREARRVQLLKYEQVQKEHAAKQKEKLDKKKAEKWKKYSHIDMGEKLPNIGQSEDVARNVQQSVNDDKIINYVLKLERENARLRAEQEKRKESFRPDTCSAPIPNINLDQMQSPRSSVQRVPFETNSVTNSPSIRSSSVSCPVTPVREFSEENSSNIRVQKSLTPSAMNVCNSPTAQEKAELEKIKEESFKRDMQIARERMQKLFSQQLNKDD